MNQPTFMDVEYDGKKRTTRKEKFLGRMDALIPWEALEERNPTVLPEGGPRARPPLDGKINERMPMVTHVPNAYSILTIGTA